MDTFEVILTKEFTEEEFPQKNGKLAPFKMNCVNFYINGEPLIETVCKRLRSDGDGSGSAYCIDAGLEPQDILMPFTRLLIEPVKTESVLKEENGKIIISRCRLCGELLCGGFTIRVTVYDDRVVWDQIGHWNDTRVEGVAGPFEFNREEYEQALQMEHAEYWTGRAYDAGIYFEPNPKKAMEYFKLSAEKGFIPAHYYLGWYNEEGFAGRKNYRKAVEHYQIAAGVGDLWSMTNLGHMYGLGKGVRKDYSIAVEYYQKAAAEEDPLAITNLAWCYEHGKGVDKDLSIARDLYYEAAEMGEEHALEWLEEQSKGQKTK